MSELEIASFAAAIASLVLAIVAIVLSIVFYRMSSQLSESAREAAKDVGSSVEKLEKLFDRLYADTFSMMRETVSEMGKHAWGETSDDTSDMLNVAERRADEKIETLRERMEEQIGTIFAGQQDTDDRVKELQGRLSELVGRAIEDSRKVEHEAREETIRQYILRRLRELQRRKQQVTADDLVTSLGKEFPPQRVISELHEMKEDRILDWDGPGLGPETVVYKKRSRK